LKAPFKAIGRLFGAGRKTRTKLQRLSRKDVKKFESVGARKSLTRALPVSKRPRALRERDPAMPRSRRAGNLERGRALLNSGNATTRSQVLSTAVSTDPTLHEAYNLLGVAYEMKGLRESRVRVVSRKRSKLITTTANI
jgi:Flp pilus assembly protein TadD